NDLLLPHPDPGWSKPAVAGHSGNGHERNGRAGPGDIKVLMYHGIVDDENLSRNLWTFLDTGKFRKHLELLDQWGFTTITFRDFQLHCEGKLTLPAKPVILTFDDG